MVIKGFFPGGGFQCAILADQRGEQALAVIIQRVETADLAQHAAVDCGIPIAFDAHQVIVAGEHIDAAADRAAHADRRLMLHLGLAAAVGAPAVDQGAGRADLHAVPAGNAGGLAQRDAQIGDQEAVGAAFFKAQGEIAHQFAAGANAAPAQDAAVVFQDEIWMRGIHREGCQLG